LTDVEKKILTYYCNFFTIRNNGLRANSRSTFFKNYGISNDMTLEEYKAEIEKYPLIQKLKH